MTQIKPPFLHLSSSVLTLAVEQILRKPYWNFLQPAVIVAATHSLFLFFTHFAAPTPSLSCLFTCPLMGRGLHLQCVFRCIYVSLPICERAPLFCDQVLTDVCFPAFILKRVFPQWRLSFFLGYTLRLLIMDKVAEGNHNRYKCMRGGNFKGANFPLPRKRKERGRNAFNWEQRVR